MDDVTDRVGVEAQPWRCMGEPDVNVYLGGKHRGEAGGYTRGLTKCQQCDFTVKPFFLFKKINGPVRIAKW